MRPAELPHVFMLVALQGAVSAASLVVEIVAGRVLAPYVGMSLYTWTSVIAVVLAGFSAGHWLGGRIAEATPARALRLTAWSMLGAGVTAALAVFLLRVGASFILPRVSDAVTAIVALSMLAFFLPSFFAGVPAPVLAQISVAAAPDRSGRALGAMFAAGALGAIAGTLLAGFVFIAWLGSTLTLAVVAMCYLAAAGHLFWLAWRAGDPAAPLWPALVCLLGVLAAGGSLAQSDPCTVESDYFCIRTIDVSADPSAPVHMMVLDHLVHGMGARDLPEVMFTDHAALLDLLAQARMGKRAFSAFFIGGGSYSLPRRWTFLDPAPQITVAEIDAQVTAVATRDFWFDPDTAEVLHEDARRALARRDRTYDVIVGDAFTDIAVPAHLITAEFFTLVRSRLSPDGVYLMNVIDFSDRLTALAALVETQQSVFPEVEIWVEARRPAPGERMIYVLAAGNAPSPLGQVQGRSPDAITFVRMRQEVEDRLIAKRGGLILTDDFAPIDRLMGRSF